MRAVTFQAPGVIEVSDVAEPELLDATDAIVRVEASGICGSDLHIFHGRVRIEPGFTIGHEYVGTVTAVGEDVTRVAVGDRGFGRTGSKAEAQQHGGGKQVRQRRPAPNLGADGRIKRQTNNPLPMSCAPAAEGAAPAARWLSGLARRHVIFVS